MTIQTNGAVDHFRQTLHNALNAACDAAEGDPVEQAAIIAVDAHIENILRENAEYQAREQRLYIAIAQLKAGLEKAVEQRNQAYHDAERDLEVERFKHDGEMALEQKHSIENALRRLSGQIAVDTENAILMPEARMVFEVLAGLRMTNAAGQLIHLYDAIAALAEALGDENVLDAMRQRDHE